MRVRGTEEVFVVVGVAFVTASTGSIVDGREDSNNSFSFRGEDGSWSFSGECERGELFIQMWMGICYAL